MILHFKYNVIKYYVVRKIVQNLANELRFNSEYVFTAVYPSYVEAATKYDMVKWADTKQSFAIGILYYRMVQYSTKKDLTFACGTHD